MKVRFCRLFRLGWLLCLLSATQAQANSVSRENLLGVWGSSEDNGKTFWGFDQFLPNGKLQSWGTLPESELAFEIEGFYKLSEEQENTVNCIVITYSSQPDLLPVGEEICSLLLKITTTEMHYVDAEGQYHVLYKQNINQLI